jgi:hypothetical protein
MSDLEGKVGSNWAAIYGALVQPQFLNGKLSHQQISRQLENVIFLKYKLPYGISMHAPLLEKL